MNRQAALMSQQLESTKRSIEQTQEMLGYARQQASASSIQMDIAKQSERPYVVIREISLSSVSSDARPSWVVVYGNSGRTTAQKLQMKIVLQLSAIPLSENPVYPEAPNPASVFDLGAGEQARATDTANFVLKSSDITAIKQGKSWLYIYGIGQYLDGNGQVHVMKFCSYYDPATRSPLFCSQHNSSG